MQTLVEDFGTDHWYQLDGYLNGGTAPWMDARSDLQSAQVRIDSIFNSLVIRFIQINSSHLCGQTAALTAHPALADTLAATSSGMSQEPPPVVVDDEAWYRRGVAAYTGLNRTDADAVWSFQVRIATQLLVVDRV